MYVSLKYVYQSGFLTFLLLEKHPEMLETKVI